MCEKLNYDLTPFTTAYEKVKELNYENKYLYQKQTFSPDRKLKAGIQIEIVEEKAIHSVLFSDKNGNELKSITFLETLPHYLFIYKLQYKGKWLSPDTYTISDKSKQIFFDVSFSSGDVSVRFEPKTRSIEELEEGLCSVKQD